MQTLHSILIAINDYPNNPLKGCINDVENMRTTLADFCKSKGLNYKEHLLINNAATRPAIIEAYKQFKTASEGDTCLVYYSGHGYRIAANPSQWTDGDSLHEAIYTFDADTGGRGLVNKELAYLMWKNTQHVNNVHVVEIFDCCHAGGITRTIGDNVTARTIPGESKALPQQEYFGFQEYINNGNGRFAAPVARRVQLAASTGKETSKELTINNLRRGAFTTSICEILREDNFNVSYKDLLAKANVKVKNYIKDVKKDFGDQSPQIDAERVESETQVFTGKGMATSQSYIVGFSQESGFWEIKAGLIESISQNAQIRITETGDTFTLSEVTPSISKVLLPQKYDRNKQYHAEVIASFNNKIIVAFSSQVTENQKNIFNAAFAKSYDEKGLVPRFFEKIEDAQFASFLIHCEGDDFYLTTKKDVHTPLFLRCPSEDLAAFFDASEKVGKWFIVKDLNNPSSALTTNDIKVEIAIYSASGNYERPLLKNWQDGIPTECTYDLIQDTPKQPRIALGITNNARNHFGLALLF